jgi:hypothetical protein
MSAPPAAPTISIQLEAVEALAAELAALSGQLSDDAALCRSTAASLYAALSLDEGWAAGSAATIWAELAGVVADRSRAVARSLADAVAAYRTQDAALASAIGSDTPAEREGGR